jgi:hypothetical protein
MKNGLHQKIANQLRNIPVKKLKSLKMTCSVVVTTLTLCGYTFKEAEKKVLGFLKENTPLLKAGKTLEVEIMLLDKILPKK